MLGVLRRGVGGRGPVAEVPLPEDSGAVGIESARVEPHPHPRNPRRRQVLEVHRVEVRGRGLGGRRVAQGVAVGARLPFDRPGEVRQQLGRDRLGLPVEPAPTPDRDRALDLGDAARVVHHGEGDGVRPGLGVDVRRAVGLGGRPVAEVPGRADHPAVGVRREVLELHQLTQGGRRGLHVKGGHRALAGTSGAHARRCTGSLHGLFNVHDREVIAIEGDCRSRACARAA